MLPWAPVSLRAQAEGCTCAPWTKVSTNIFEQKRIDSYWADGKPPAAAGAACAMPAASAGKFECDGCTVDKTCTSETQLCAWY